MIRPSGAQLAVYLQSGKRYYCRYEAEDGSRQHITSGGGGAFSHPTHDLPERMSIPGPDGPIAYRRAATYPSPAVSKRLRRRIWLLTPYNLHLVPPRVPSGARLMGHRNVASRNQELWRGPLELVTPHAERAMHAVPAATSNQPSASGPAGSWNAKTAPAATSRLTGQRTTPDRVAAIARTASPTARRTKPPIIGAKEPPAVKVDRRCAIRRSEPSQRRQEQFESLHARHEDASGEGHDQPDRAQDGRASADKPAENDAETNEEATCQQSDQTHGVPTRGPVDDGEQFTEVLWHGGMKRAGYRIGEGRGDEKSDGRRTDHPPGRVGLGWVMVVMSVAVVLVVARFLSDVSGSEWGVED